MHLIQLNTYALLYSKAIKGQKLHYHIDLLIAHIDPLIALPRRQKFDSKSLSQIHLPILVILVFVSQYCEQRSLLNILILK